MSVTEKRLKKQEYRNQVHTGLSENEARRKLEKHGPNTIVGKKKVSALKIMLGQFSDFMVLILLASTAISALMGEATEALTIVAIVIINAVLGFIQEYKTEKTMDALKNLAAPAAKVIRGGRLSVIPAEQVVPGDLVSVETGDRVPADMLLIEAGSLFVDESLLTGESMPVEKNEGSVVKNVAGATSKSNALYLGTTVTGGRAKGIVYATGMNTETGKIADMMQNIQDEGTPLQKKLDYLGRFIAYGCLVTCAVVSVTGVLRGEDLFAMLLSGISLAVAAVPEGLPAIVTISLALGVQRMLRKNALIRKLPAVETLGCASVICSDKTGTLTENRMTVRGIYAGDNLYEVKGSGYNIEGSFLLNGSMIDPRLRKALTLALEIAALCNNAGITGSQAQPLPSKLENRQMQLIGDPTECALFVAALKGGITTDILDEEYFRIHELPFDSERKCMSVICDNRKGETFVFTKGAPDIIIEKCSRIYASKGIIALSPVTKRHLERMNDRMAGNALRVIGVAYKRLDSRIFEHKDVENNLIFAGLFGMLDPPRKDALEAVQKCKMAGIKPVMITGDHRLTAAAIAMELGICSEGDVILTGADLEKIDEAVLERQAENVPVYARVSPRHKLMIVNALKRCGHIVAMTGDGVNDAPAVKEADIGVSMGISGTDVTKEASSMVLLDDNFATIVAAVEEGRVIYSNIRKFIRYMLSCNIGEVLTMFLGMLAGLPLPLLPIQILWVNLVTDGLPAIALGFDPPERDIMKIPPRTSKENIFSHGLLNLILFRGSLIGLSTLAVFTSALHFSGSIECARTAAFMTLVITQLIHVFECKSERRNIFEVPFFNNIALVLSVVCSLAMILGVVYIPFFQQIFKTIPLALNDWLPIVGFSAFGPVFASLFRINKR